MSLLLLMKKNFEFYFWDGCVHKSLVFFISSQIEIAY